MPKLPPHSPRGTRKAIEPGELHACACVREIGGFPPRALDDFSPHCDFANQRVGLEASHPARWMTFPPRQATRAGDLENFIKGL